MFGSDLLIDLHTGFSGGRSGGLVFLSLSEFSTVVIHKVKGFSVVSEAEVYVFLEFSCFFYDPADVDSLMPGSFAFPKSSLNIWRFSVHALLKPHVENFERHCARVWDECTVLQVAHSLPLSFLGLEWKAAFSSPVATAGILSAALSQHHLLESEIAQLEFYPPVALSIVMLPKAHLTLRSKVFGSRWVITPITMMVIIILSFTNNNLCLISNEMLKL